MNNHILARGLNLHALAHFIKNESLIQAQINRNARRIREQVAAYSAFTAFAYPQSQEGPPD